MKFFSQQSLRFLGLSAIALAFFIVAGGPLILLQGVAWVGMVYDYSQNDTWTHAVEKTFSGKYRCSLCKKIAEQSKREQKTPALVNADKALKATLSERVILPTFLVFKKISFPQLLASHYQSFAQEPPTPYP